MGGINAGRAGDNHARAAQIMEARREEIASWIIHESGSTRIKANLEWNAVHGALLEATTLPYLVEGRILPADIPGKESRMYRKPVGVVGVISPWNWHKMSNVAHVSRNNSNQAWRISMINQ